MNNDLDHQLYIPTDTHRAIGTTDIPASAPPEQIRNELSRFLASGRISDARELLEGTPEGRMPGEELAVLRNSVAIARQMHENNPHATIADFQSRFGR